MARRPIRQDPGLNEFLVDSLLFVVEIRIQHVVRQLFFGECRDRIPAVSEGRDYGAAPSYLVQSEVVSKIVVGHGGISNRFLSENELMTMPNYAVSRNDLHHFLRLDSVT